MARKPKRSHLAYKDLFCSVSAEKMEGMPEVSLVIVFMPDWHVNLYDILITWIDITPPLMSQ